MRTYVFIFVPIPEDWGAQELRVDHSFSDTRPFNDSSDETMFTGAVDAIITF